MKRGIVYLYLVLSVISVYARNPDPIKDMESDPWHFIKNVEFNNEGMSVITTFKYEIDAVYVDERKANYMKWKTLKPGDRLQVKFGDWISMGEYHGIFSIMGMGERRFLINIGFNAGSFGDGSKVEFFYPYRKKDGVDIVKIGEKYTSFDEGESKNPLFVNNLAFVKNIANSESIDLGAYSGGSKYVATFGNIRKEIKPNFIERLSYYGIYNDKIGDDVILYYRNKSILVNINNYLWNYLCGLFATDNPEDGKRLKDAKCELPTPTRPEIKVPSSFPEDLNTADKAVEKARKAFAEGYQSAEAQKANPGFKEIPNPSQFVCKVLKLKDSVEHFAPAGTEIWQVEMFDEKNGLICAAWINPSNNTGSAKSPDNAAAETNAEPIIFILEPVQALLVK